MKKPKSKYLAAALFIALPFIGFVMGMKYQEQLSSSSNWRAYSSTLDQSRLAFKYPSTWTIDSNQTAVQPKELIFRDKDEANHIWGSIAEISGDSFCGQTCDRMTEEQFFDRTQPFWQIGDIGGGGPGTTRESVEDAVVGGRRALVTITHPTTDYEWSTRDDYVYTYYVFMGGVNSNILKIEFNLSRQTPQRDELLHSLNEVIDSIQFEK